MSKFILIFLICLATVVLTAWADGGSSTSGGDGGDGGDGRDLSMENDGTEVTFTSDRSSGFIRDRIQFKIDVNGRLEIKLNYYFDTNTTETAFYFAARFEQLIQYFESNGQPGYQPGEEVSIIDLNSYTGDGNSSRSPGETWNPINCVQSNSSFVCTVSTSDNIFTVVVHIAGAVFSVGNTQVPPTALKIDVIINKDRGTTGDSMALLVQFSASKEVNQEIHQGEDGQHNDSQIAFGAGGFFSWDPTATVNGVVANVLNSKLNVSTGDATDHHEDGSEDGQDAFTQLVFSFNSTANGVIVWDPKVGITSALSPGITSSATSIIPNIFSFVIAFILSIICSV